MSVLVFTPALLAARKQARENFPDAEFLPGDDPPVGERLRRANGEVVEVIGRYDAPTETDAMAFWWRVWLPGPFTVGGQTMPRVEALEWPPYLHRVQP